MRTEPARELHGCDDIEAGSGRWNAAAVLLAAVLGLGLMGDAIGRSSATYDEVAYLRVASHWWRTGQQDEITRMGSPLTFWKVQQAPVLWVLDRVGCRALADDPIGHQAELLPIVRAWSLGIWLVALAITANWARRLYGPRAMVLAAWLFALSPNLLAHGGLATMELPLVASTTGMYALFWRFLQSGDRRMFWASAALGGLAFSCKFTTVLVPPTLGLVWWIERWKDGERGPFRRAWKVGLPMLGFLAVMFLANLVVTGFATLPLSHAPGAHPSLDGRFGPTLGRWVSRAVETPIPSDWVGFATQMQHQRSGGSSYLLGARRMTGWWYYYFVCLAVKVPLTFWVLIGARIALGTPHRTLPLAKGELEGVLHSFGRVPDPPQSPLVKGGSNRTLPLTKGELEGVLPGPARIGSQPPSNPPPRGGTPEMGDALRASNLTATSSNPIRPGWHWRLARPCPEAIEDTSGQAASATRRDAILPIVIGCFLAITAVGSSRNYGLRYLLPLAPLAIVWVSSLAEGGRSARRWAALGLVGQALAVASIHPHELTYFNTLAGGPVSGRRILSDSNLDWGQGLRSLARLQRERPEFRDLTLYYFGDTDASHYGVSGRLHTIDAGRDHPGLPPALEAETAYIAVSASLQWGPWGPEGYFHRLDGVRPILLTDDTTIAIYRTADLRTDPGRGCETHHP